MSDRWHDVAAVLLLLLLLLYHCSSTTHCWRPAASRNNRRWQ
jgi:hypothetical protein